MTKIKTKTIRYKSMKMDGFQIINLSLFPYDIMVATEVTVEQIVERMKRYNVELDEKHLKYLKRNGKAHTVKMPNNAVLIYFPKKPSQGIIAHEAFHAVWMVLATMGVEPSVDSEEVYAYMIEFVVDLINGKLTL